MKKLLLCLAAASLVFVACKKSSSTASLVGTWTVNSEIDWETVSGLTTKDTLSGSAVTGEGIIFTSDSAYVNLGGGIDTLFYVRSGNNLIGTSINNPTPDTIAIQNLTSTNLTLYHQNGSAFELDQTWLYLTK